LRDELANIGLIENLERVPIVDPHRDVPSEKLRVIIAA